MNFEPLALCAYIKLNCSLPFHFLSIHQSSSIAKHNFQMCVYALASAFCCSVLGLSAVIVATSLREKPYEFCVDLIIPLGLPVGIFMWMIKKAVSSVMKIDLKV